MPQSHVLAVLRGPDGRSLARALVVLLLFGLFGAGVHAGAMAGDGGNTVFCIALAKDTAPAVPGHHDGDTCCLTGCNPAQPMLVTTAAGIAAPRVAFVLRTPVVVATRPDGRAWFRQRARGPPLAA